MEYRMLLEHHRRNQAPPPPQLHRNQAPPPPQPSNGNQPTSSPHIPSPPSKLIINVQSPPRTPPSSPPGNKTPMEPPLEAQPITRTGAIAAFILGSVVVGKFVLPETKPQLWELMLNMCVVFTAAGGLASEVNHMLIPTTFSYMKYNSLIGRVLTTVSFYLCVFGFMYRAHVAVKTLSLLNYVGIFLASLPVWTLITYGYYCTMSRLRR